MTVFRVVVCPKCGWIQVTRAKRPRCRRCNFSGSGFRKLAEFDEGWRATIFIQRLKEYMEVRNSHE